MYGDYGKYVDVNLKHTLFVFAGAFNNQPNITLDDLRTFGVKTEFLGRVGLVYNTKKLTLEDLYTILENSPLLAKYLELFPNVKREDVVNSLKDYLKTSYENNTLGARAISTLIHQYFIKGGKLGMEEVSKVTFSNKMEL